MMSSQFSVVSRQFKFQVRLRRRKLETARYQLLTDH
jgi:hypothetical protein